MTTRSIAVFGEVLFDSFPDGVKVLGGAPFNVAWHLQALGQAGVFISRVGEDSQGLAIKRAMQAWGMSVTHLQTDRDYPTGAVQVSFIENQPHYAILDLQAYDFIEASQLTLPPCALLYHGSLALRHRVSAQAWQQLKQTQPSAKIFLDVNLREPWWQAQSLEGYALQAHYLKLNEHELYNWQQSREDLAQLMPRLLNKYALETLIVTCGERGAVALNQAGELVRVTPCANFKLVDSVGAGDAFSAVLLLGLQRDWTLETSMNRAQHFASALIEKRGATVDDKTFYQDFCQQWQ